MRADEEGAAHAILGRKALIPVEAGQLTRPPQDLWPTRGRGPAGALGGAKPYSPFAGPAPLDPRKSGPERSFLLWPFAFAGRA
jgi:hypothetical protein